ncbi:ComEC/Rec2 family competence protein [uncultured Ruminococcus sp.]|uniref:ComEC/Rec2 family competence protein n=1 Tax=uncultured Ruminococcus sp. TaxID=165186 RepID=UPI002607D005|nr:ComEC/Rec2 family competence protein [uncultured Ruminococcus sp.]
MTDTIDQAFGGEETAGEGSCSVYFLDVGQGDSSLIVTDTAAVLIDAGEQSAGDDVLADLQQYGVTTLDWIIGTHPHSDHIGGFPKILEYAAAYDDLTVANVMTPALPDSQIPTTRIYESFLDGVEANGLELTEAVSMTIDLGSASLEIIPSPGDDYSSLNDYSICAYLTCGETGFFFTGDASKPEETDLLESGALDHVQADVLKVGHHGSRESSTDDFLYAINPSYGVISCGYDNSYGHPHSEAIARLTKFCGEQIWRTDENGTVCIQSDGQQLTVTTEK